MRLHARPTVDTRLRALLACLLLASYLLVYAPRPDSADGDALLAVAAGLLREGRPTLHPVAYADWLLPLPASRMGAFGVDGALYAKKGPTPSLALLPFVAAADALPWLSTRAAAMLLNPLVTAVTGVLLYTLARDLGARPRAAFLTGLIYGWATFAVVYVKTLFGEPLAALLLVAAVLAIHRARRDASRRALVAAGIALGLLVGVNTVYILFVPLLAAYLLRSVPASRRGPATPLPGARGFVAFAAPIALALALLALYNVARFGSPFDGGYHFAEGEAFNRPLLLGLYGLFLSPFRGLVWYNPVLLLAVPGWLLLRRRDARFAWLLLGAVALQGLAFAAWWSWHGGIVWGPRFLIPVTPLLALCLAPLLDRAGDGGTLVRAGRLALVALLPVSIVVQLLGVLYSYAPYVNGYLNARFWTGDFDAMIPALRDEVLYSPVLSPIVGHMALVAAGWPLEPAWLARGIDGLHLLAALAVAAVGLLLVLPRVRLPALAVWSLVALVTLVAVNIVVARQSDWPDMLAARAVDEALQPAAPVFAATTLYDSSLIDLERRPVTVINAPTAPDDPWARSLFDDALRRGGLLWLVTWFGPADPLNWPERALWESAAFVRAAPLIGHRALLFDLDAEAAASRPAGHRFGPFRLDAVAIGPQRDRLRVTLHWSAVEPPDADFAWFVHLVDAGGAIIAQQDRAPMGGYAPTSGWTPGATVTDRLAFLLPDGANIEDGSLRVGWIDPATGDRLPATAPDGTPLPDDALLLSLRPGQ